MQTHHLPSAPKMHVNKYVLCIYVQVNIMLTSHRITFSFISDVNKNQRGLNTSMT